MSEWQLDLTGARHDLKRASEPIRLFEPAPAEMPGQTALDVHPDLLARCPRCGFQALEHDPYDMRCPDDDDEARLNREDQLP